FHVTGVQTCALPIYIVAAVRESGRFVRCSSEFPFLPGPQRVWQMAREGKLGRLLEVHSGFQHSSDLDPNKPINWKRQTKFCGEIDRKSGIEREPMDL